MNESPIISKRIVRKNKSLKAIQKDSKKKYGKEKFNDIRNRIDKIIKIREVNEFYDFSANRNTTYNDNELSANEILEKIKLSNLQGLSGSGYPTIKKINASRNSINSDKYLIVNGVECDPGLIHDEWLIKNKLHEIEEGISLIKKCISFKEVVLATKLDIKSKVVKTKKVPNIYPIGAERILIDNVLDIKISNDEIPSEKGILVLNVQTVLAIYEVIKYNKVFNSKYITVADVNSGEAVVAKVDFNSNAMDILKKVFPNKNNLIPYIGGGIMMSKELKEDDYITYKTNIISYGKETDYDNGSKCKGCGLCVKKCPMNIDIKNIMKSIEKNNMKDVDFSDLNKCLKCGSCSYYCRARKNVMLILHERRKLYENK